MPRPRKQLIRTVEHLAARALGGSGLRKRAEGIYTCELADEYLGVVGLNIATRGMLEINPVIGVRHQPTERMVAQFLGNKFHPYAPPTVSRPLGYLTPENRYLAWYFAEGEGDIEQTVRDMAETIDQYGKPFMEENSRLESLCASLEAGYCATLGQRAYRLPIVHALLGNPEAGERVVREELRQLEGAAHGYAQDYRQYAEHCLEWLSAQRSVN